MRTDGFKMGLEVDDYEIERLRAELQQESQMREMLDQSKAELRNTVDELEKRYEAIDEEGNEWKTRYETQQEMNQQLEKQILLLHTKVDEHRNTLKENQNKVAKDKHGDLSEITPHAIRVLEKEKNSLEGQLRDLEWRLDQESKAYHKANEERKQYTMEISSTKYRKEGASNAGVTPRMGGNIPNNQRILDPKRGPIKKTAAVKNLPRLEPEY